jgi:hypothetical protein
LIAAQHLIMGRRSRHPYSTQDGRPICFACKKPGHIARDCAAIEKPQEDSIKETLIITCIFSGGPNPKSGVLCRKVRCLGRDIEPVLSTSTASVMTKELWHELNCLLLPWNKTKVVNIIGQEMEYIGVAQLRITLDGREACGLVFVVVDGAVDMILGRDFLSQWGLRIVL